MEKNRRNRAVRGGRQENRNMKQEKKPVAVYFIQEFCSNSGRKWRISLRLTFHEGKVLKNKSVYVRRRAFQREL